MTPTRFIRTLVLFISLALLAACSSSTTRDDPTALDVADVGPSPGASGSPGSPDRGVGEGTGTAGADGEATGSSSGSSAGTTTSTGGTDDTDGGATGGSAGTATTSASTTTSGSAPPTEAEPFVLGLVQQSQNAAGQLGLELDIPTDARLERWIEALRDHVNERGGVAGHELQTVIRWVDQSDQSEANQTRLQTQVCTEMTEDLNVDMVAGDATNWVLECYASHQMPLFNPLITRDEEQLEPVRPWVLPSLFLTFDRLAQLFPLSLEQQGGISERMGVITFDLPWYNRAVDDILVPEIKRRGGEVLQVVRTPVDPPTIAAQMQSAALQFKTQDIDEVVMFANGGGTWLLFAQAAESQNYHPGYGVSTLDRAYFITDAMPPGQLGDVKGPGFLVTFDVDPDQYPPISDQERECWAILNERADEDFEGRNSDSSIASAICDIFFLMHTALDGAAPGTLARERVPDLFAQMGRSYVSTIVGPTDFSAGRGDAVDRYRNMIYDTACTCMRYVTDPLPIPFN
ncbi:MAG TPA: hypothetical protein VGA69_13075 [Nitriliruptorales bacterium]